MNELSDAELTLQVEDEILAKHSWGELPWLLRNGHISCIPIGELSLEEKASSVESGEGPVWMILRAVDSEGKTFFFKKVGRANSYDDTSWEGKFRRVYPQSKTVTVYEFGDNL